MAVLADDSGLTARLGTLTMTLLPMGGHDFAAIRRDKDKRFTVSFTCQKATVVASTWNPDGPVVFKGDSHGLGHGFNT